MTACTMPNCVWMHPDSQRDCRAINCPMRQRLVTAGMRDMVDRAAGKLIDGESRELTVAPTEVGYSRYRIQGVPVGQPVKSGHWWVHVTSGHADHDGSIIVNGDTLLFPQRDWFVCEDHRFKALLNSSLPMLWLNGDDLWEKTFTRGGRMGAEIIIGMQKVGDAGQNQSGVKQLEH